MRFRDSRGFTLVEIVIVVAIIAIVVGIAAPTWFRQREISRATACQENLGKIDHAIEQYAMEFRLSNGAPINYPDDLIKPAGVDKGSGFLRVEPTCNAGGTYTVTVVGTEPTCSIGATNDPFASHVIQN
ncbi:MAG: prepilin-type N-terminal cleavage/methylation domain-containing protein [Candidatus Sumerlaeaceae bacterium]